MLGAAVPSYWVTWFPGALLATLGVLTMSWKGLRWLSNATTTLKQVQVALPLIQAEFNPNSGHSMKDRVEALHDRVEAADDRSNKWQARHAHDDDRRFAKVEASLERIEDHLTR